MKRLVLSSFLLFVYGTIVAQTLRFQPSFHQLPLVLDSSYVTADSTTVAVSILRFYVSHVQLLNGEEVVWLESDSYHLVDAADSASLQIVLPSGVKADGLSFLLGSDSLANVSGAMGGDLDPSRGMYWAWNSGYINFKLEGTSPICTSRNNEFQFHLGGYAYPNATVQQVKLELSDASVTVLVDVAQLLETVDLKALSMVMSPGAEAVALSKQAATIFRVKDEE
ncbi:MAG: hypothetical protein K9J17_12605 [Flavobacteriales bacterium]|nr:hypothetical protein [Flavobacteriales bacterium]